MKRTLFFALGGLLLGGIIHIAIVLLLPLYAVNDAWANVERLGRSGQFHLLELPEPGSEAVASLDPRMMHAICRFDLADGPIRITANMPDEFWSVAVFDRRGRNIYSLNDRASERSRLDLVVLTPVQMAQIRQDPPESLETSIVLELPVQNGFALLRAFVPDDTYVLSVTSALKQASCAGTL